MARSRIALLSYYCHIYSSFFTPPSPCPTTWPPSIPSRRASPTSPAPPPSLRYLSLSRNSMWGLIDSLKPLSDLAYLDLGMNWFYGLVPASLFRSSLSSMLLQRNDFSSELPATINCPDLGSYGSGSVVDLSHNRLTGKLTTVLAGVESLYLNHHHLTGAMPTEYVESLIQGRTRTLFLQHNNLTAFPLDKGTALPDTAALCLSYNCMFPPIGLEACPASSGNLLSRQSSQCPRFGGSGVGR